MPKPAISRRRRWILRTLTGLVITTLVLVTAVAAMFFIGPATLGIASPVVTPRVNAALNVLPDISGSDYSNHRVTVAHPAVLLVGAHWCHYCQSEVARLNSSKPADLPPGNLYFVSTWQIWPFAWPPADRLHLADFPGQVLVDTSALIARELGVQDVPTWVFTDAQGRIRLRHTGELSPAELRQMAVDAQR